MERFLVGGLILACLGYNCVWAESFTVIVGKNITLSPPPGSDSPITSVAWRHFEDFAAEWSTSDTAVEYYRNFKGRTHLNTLNGDLSISKMTETEAGTYSVEINGKKLSDKYVVMVVEELPTPKLWEKPGKGDDERELDCSGDVSKVGTVTYWWNINKEFSWVQSERKIILKNNETTRQIEKISCKIVNVLEEKISSPLENPFYPKPKDSSALGALVIIPVLAVLVGIGIWKRDVIKKRFCPGDSTGNHAAIATEEDTDKKERSTA